ncbi:hypothetical protein NQ314_015033 [Rhamnusium bicolor]|uniref:Uncharacterized protein n=1 Tax=Rhamnusium bicolor TaxID=1586634 RepID=A0AAV8X0C8_9CUCU|nr:hypothetical protein NQ314_015033 [Rhamnusium bicolor]
MSNITMSGRGRNRGIRSKWSEQTLKNAVAAVVAVGCLVKLPDHFQYLEELYPDMLIITEPISQQWDIEQH